MTVGHFISMLLVVFLAATNTVTCFILSGGYYRCSPSPPCSCNHDGIDCLYKNLTDIPNLRYVLYTQHIDYLSIDLSHNQITSVPGQAFENISYVNTSKLWINLNHNGIVDIHPDAFAGIEDKAIDLDLDNNGIVSLQTAFGEHKHLHRLSLRSNPLTTLDASFTTYLGKSLLQLLFDMDHFVSWPDALNDLKVLQYLDIRYIPFDHLPKNAFDGLVSLTELYITFSKLERIPAAICRIPELQKLNFEDNEIDDNYTTFEQCSTPQKNLIVILMKNNKFNTFPEVLWSFPSVTNLNLRRNNISVIPMDSIPNSHGLRTLNFENNMLTGIPPAVNKLTHITDLSFHKNHIISVENTNLQNLSDLNQLDISNNLIEYIAPDAFKNNTHIKWLDLTANKLYLIPEAVQVLHHLEALHFYENHAECSCRLSYLKDWAYGGDTIGYCFNQTYYTINQYILTDLQKCP